MDLIIATVSLQFHFNTVSNYINEYYKYPISEYQQDRVLYIYQEISNIES